MKAALCFRGLRLPNLYLSDQLSAFLVSIHPNQISKYRNVQADDICSDLSIMSAASDSWRKRKDVPSVEKDCMQDGGMKHFGRS